jgi:peptidoglycan/LPS O-acetylase OafA/YrhL
MTLATLKTANAHSCQDIGMSRSAHTRIECLDGLRGLAALWVLMGHCVMLAGWSLPIIDKPDLGVDLFMMLSGFLMVFHYQERAAKEPWSEPATWWRFWLRRYFRIAPLYYVALTIAVLLGPAVFAWRLLVDQFVGLPSPPAATFIDRSFTNITLHLSFVFGLLPAYSARTALPDWSLGLEMQFYAVFPALMLLTKKLGWLFAVFLLAMLAAIVTHATWHLRIRYPMPSFLSFKLDIFLAGMLVAQCCRQERGNIATYFALMLILALQPFQGEGSLERIVVREIMIVTFFSLILNKRLPGYLAVAAHKIATILSGKGFRWLGEVSYGTYLWHLPVATFVIAWLTFKWGHSLSPFARFMTGLVLVSTVVYPLSWLTYRFVEVPGQILGRATLRRLPAKRASTQEKRAERLASASS